MKTKFFITNLLISSIFIGTNVIAQNYQIDVNRRGNQYDVNVNQSSRRSINLNGVNMVSGSPTINSGVDLNSIRNAADRLEKQYHENQNMYYEAYNQLINIPANNECQKNLKDKLLNEFEQNVKNQVRSDRWFDSEVRKNINEEVLRINREISNDYDRPCIAPNIIEQINNLSKQGKYEDALSLYEKNSYNLINFFGTSDKIDNFHIHVLIPLYKKVYNGDITKYIAMCKSDLMLVEQNMGTYISPQFNSLTAAILSGYNALEDWDNAILINTKRIERDSDGMRIAHHLFLQSEYYYLKKDKEKALKHWEGTKKMFKFYEIKEKVDYCEKIIKKIKKNDFSEPMDLNVIE